MSFEDLPPQASMFPAADEYAATCLRLGEAALGEVEAVQDVPYGSDYWQKLDVFGPRGGGSRLPVVVFFHGGGWTHGYKEWCAFMAPAVVASPAVFVSASYRLVPHADYQGVMADSIALLRWVHENIVAHGGDPDRVWIGGHSAGGQIASLLTLQPELLAEAGLPADFVKGCFPVSGTFGKDTVMPKNAAGEVIDTFAIVPPLSLVRGPTVPFFINWGGLEDEKIQTWGRQMHDALAAAGTEVVSDVAEGEDHFTIHLNTRNRDDVWTRTVRAWISR